MSMTPEQAARSEALQREFISRPEVRDLVGIEPWSGELEGLLFASTKSLRRPRAPFQDDKVSRYLLEGFLLDHRLQPRQRAATRLGMKTGWLVEIIDAMLEHG